MLTQSQVIHSLFCDDSLNTTSSAVASAVICSQCLLLPIGLSYHWLSSLLCNVPTGFPYALDIHEASEKTVRHTSYYQDSTKLNKYSQKKQKLNFTLKLQMI